MAVLALMAAESADAKGRNCARPNTVTLASTYAARVYRPRGRLGYRMYGCLKSLDRAYRLDRNTGRPAYWAYGGKPNLEPNRPGGTNPTLLRWYFAGRFVGFWARHLGTNELWIYSLRSGRMAVRVTEYWGSIEGGVSWGPSLATNGVPVWISYAGDEGLYSDAVLACRDTGASAWSRPCWYGNSTSPFVAPTTLGSGGDHTLRSLRVSGVIARWTKPDGVVTRNLASLGS